MIAAGAGGYDPRLGFSPSIKGRVPTPASGADGKPADMGGDWRSQGRSYVSLTRHLGHVETAARDLCKRLGIGNSAGPVVIAARWHDVGKAHDVFRTTMRYGLSDNHPYRSVLLAKSRRWKRPGRHYFRHELASALAWLDHRRGEPDEDLLAFLARNSAVG